MVGRPLDSVPPRYDVAASIGVAVWEPGDGAEPTADFLLRTADEAMYASKDAGRDRVTIVMADETSTTDTAHDPRAEASWEH